MDLHILDIERREDLYEQEIPVSSQTEVPVSFSGSECPPVFLARTSIKWHGARFERREGRSLFFLFRFLFHTIAVVAFNFHMECQSQGRHRTDACK
jgi:hypothetical protein